MDSRTVLFACVSALFALFILIRCFKSAHPVRNLFFSVFSGIGALFAVNAAGIFSGVTLGVNPYTIGVSALGGVPGVIALLVIKLLILRS